MLQPITPLLTITVCRAPNSLFLPKREHPMHITLHCLPASDTGSFVLSANACDSCLSQDMASWRWRTPPPAFGLPGSICCGAAFMTVPWISRGRGLSQLDTFSTPWCWVPCVLFPVPVVYRHQWIGTCTNSIMSSPLVPGVHRVVSLRSYYYRACCGPRRSGTRIREARVWFP